MIILNYKLLAKAIVKNFHNYNIVLCKKRLTAENIVPDNFLKKQLIPYFFKKFSLRKRGKARMFFTYIYKQGVSTMFSYKHRELL